MSRAFMGYHSQPATSISGGMALSDFYALTYFPMPIRFPHGNVITRIAISHQVTFPTPHAVTLPGWAIREQQSFDSWLHRQRSGLGSQLNRIIRAELFGHSDVSTWTAHSDFPLRRITTDNSSRYSRSPRQLASRR